MNGNLSRLPRRLHARSSAGIPVRLWWPPAGGRTWVAVRDIRTGAGFVLPVHADERARDVSGHPYAYTARHGITATAHTA
jgi:hypothetical protein